MKDWQLVGAVALITIGAGVAVVKLATINIGDEAARTASHMVVWPSPSPEPEEARIQETAQEHRTRLRAREYMFRLQETKPRETWPLVVAKLDPELRVSADTVLDEYGRCVLRFAPGYLEDDARIAHETCHCALHYQLLGPHGYMPGTRGTELLEDEASKCEWELLR